MWVRRAVSGLVGVLVAGSLTACAGDPVEVAARGADEVTRHGGTPWARLTVDGLQEADYVVTPAHVDTADPGVLFDFDDEYGTAFTQRFVVTGQGDPMSMLRDEILANGALMTHRGCGKDAPSMRSWNFVVESDGDVLSLRLDEVDGGVVYVAALPEGSDEDSFEERLASTDDRAPVVAIAPDPVCPLPEPVTTAP